MYSRTGTYTQTISPPMLVAAPALDRGRSGGGRSLQGARSFRLEDEAVCAGGSSLIPQHRSRGKKEDAGERDPQPGDSNVAQSKGLLHDAQNLLGAVGLYCDLLSAPGVLKAEHLHYAEDLRLVGTRSNALMERLVASSPAFGRLDKSEAEESSDRHSLVVAALPGKPVTLRAVVDRYSRLLGQVAGGRAIEVSYGAAASIPVLVDEESVERILFNLVLNAAAALKERPVGGGAAGAPPSGGRPGPDSVTVRESLDGTEDETPGAIRIGVGLLINRVGDPRPWPFRRVRLTVEDSGCGMTAEHLQRVLHTGGPSRGGHGMGLRVVRELVAGSEGELRAMSALGVGTRVQIEWPAAPVSSWEGAETHASRWSSVKIFGSTAVSLTNSIRGHSGRRLTGVAVLKAVAVLPVEAGIRRRAERREAPAADAGRRMPC
jgi:signal transduction histidine kinase